MIGNPPSERFRRAMRWSWCLLLVGSFSQLSAQVAQVVPGRNVNMVSGTEWPGGDPFLNKQNEPTIAVSTRNVLHLLGGANDYRTVDLPGLPDGKPTGDAWLGLFKSFDGGKTWTSTLIPGYPQDNTPLGATSPLKQAAYDAAADAVVRAGSNGLFYYGGIAFHRAAPISDAALQAPVGSGKPDERPAKEVKEEKERLERAKARAREEKERKERRERQERRAREEREKARNKTGEKAKTPEALELEAGFEEEEEAGADSGGSAIFVSTFLDLNNLEAGDPIRYIRTSLVDQDAGGENGRFLDKQWTSVDIPRPGAQTCTFTIPQSDDTSAVAKPPIVQSFPGGRVYVVYTAFSSVDGTQRGQIMFSSSQDCGETWSPPRNISSAPSPDLNGDGTVNATDVNRVKAAVGRRCGQPGYDPVADTNQDCIITVVDLAFVTRSLGSAQSTLRRVAQGAVVAIHPTTGALSIAWREFAAGGLPHAIVAVRSNDFGATFTAPVTVATFTPYDQATTDARFRSSAFPTIAADADRVYLAWSARGVIGATTPDGGDARIMMSTSTDGTSWSPPFKVDEPNRRGHQIMPALTFGGGKLFLLFYDLREDISKVFRLFVDETEIDTDPASTGFRHTMDVRIAQADPAPAPAFHSVRLSEYPFGVLEGTTQSQQLQFNPPNLPLFRKGAVPFVGDYISLDMSPSMVANPDGSWSFTTSPAADAGGFAVWTDNRNVRAGLRGDFSNYTPPLSPARGEMSIYDPSQVLPPCEPFQTGTRNQDVFSARFNQGLFAAVLGNAKPLGTLARAFAMTVENATGDPRSYRLTITEQPATGLASFRQFEPLSVLDVTIPALSTAARSVYVASSDPEARVVITVAEIAAPGAGEPLPAGQRSVVVINADPSNPSIENPSIENPSIENQAPIATSELFNPIISPSIENPSIENPSIENPSIENPSIENVSVSNRSVVNPSIENPSIENPSIENPSIENPSIENSTLVNGAISDTTWELRNNGNTAAVYAIRLLLNQQVPQGFFTQLIVHKTYTTPAAVDCELKVQLHNQVLLNITSPQLLTGGTPSIENPSIENPSIENATVAIAPGDTVNVTLRVFDPDKNDEIVFKPAAAVTPAAIAHAVNSDDVANGIFDRQVSIPIVITTSVLPPIVLGSGPYSEILTSSTPGTWAIVSGALPPPLTLDGSTGRISGTATTPGIYTFEVEFTESGTARTARREFVILVLQAIFIISPPLEDAVVGAPYNDSVVAVGGVGSLIYTIDSGSLPPGLTLDPDGTVHGTPTLAGSFGFTVRVTDSAASVNTITQPVTMLVGTAGNADLTMTLVASPPAAAVGDTLGYIMGVTSSGPESAANVVARLTLPSGVTFVGASDGCTLSGVVVSCQLGNLVAGGAGFDLAVVVTDTEVGGVNLVAVATVESDSPDPDLTNNTDSVETPVSGAGIRRLWVVNAGSTDAVSVFDADTDTPGPTISLAAPGTDIAFTPHGERAFVAMSTVDAVAVLDTDPEAVVDTITVANPVHVEVSPDGTRLFVMSEDGTLFAFDPNTLASLGSLAFGGSSPNGFAVTPDGRFIYAANRGADTVTVIDALSLSVTTTINVGAFPVEVAIAPDGRRAYVTNYVDSTVSVINTATNTVLTTISLLGGPQGISITPDGTKAYVANFDASAVTVIDLATNTVVASPVTGGTPNGVIVSPNGDKVFVTLYNGNQYAIIDTATDTVIDVKDAGDFPIAIDYLRRKDGTI